MGFRDLFAGKSAAPKPAAKPEPTAAKPAFDDLGVIPGENGLSFALAGFDSTLGVNGKNEYIRRYALRLKADPATMEAYIAKTGTDRRNVQHDGTLMLMPPIPGEVYIMSQWMQTLEGEMKDKGYTLPVQQIEAAMLADMDKHPARLGEGKQAAVGK